MAEKGGEPISQHFSPDQGKEDNKQSKPWQKKGIPVLRYRLGNVFTKFRDALLKATLRRGKDGNDGKDYDTTGHDESYNKAQERNLCSVSSVKVTIT